MRYLASIVVVGAVALSFFNAAAAEAPCGDPCGKPTSWLDFNGFTLRVTSPKSDGYGRWHGQFDKKSMDIQIAAETSFGGTTRTGKILMIGGRVMATSGDVGEAGYEIDALDGAILQQQLVFRLLGAALPAGPNAVRGTYKVDYSDARTGIQFATPSAQGFISPPWRVIGSVKRISSEKYQYQLALTSGVKGKTPGDGGAYASNFEGNLFKTSNARIENAMPLSGWKLYGVGVQVQKTDNGTIYDYNAAPSSESYKTVADVRKKLEEEDYPGELDASKDFAGLWKRTCDEGFGMQVKRYGSDGKYSLVFCGPGGCGNPDEGRKTYITGDKHFIVISEDEFLELDRSGGQERYLRCARATEPVLK